MKKELIIATITLLVMATPAAAVSSHATGHEQASEHNQQVQSAEVVASPTVTVSVIPTEDKDNDEAAEKTTSNQDSSACDPSLSYKNHGAYVSCVAHLHLGGQAVSAAARSDIGKHHETTSPTPSISVTPSATPSVSPTETPTETPTGEPVTGGAQTLQTGFNPLASFGALLNRFLGLFQHLV